MKIKLLVELDFDAERTYGDSSSAQAWFMSDVLGADPDSLGGLILHSNEVGDEIGTVRVLEVLNGDEDGTSGVANPIDYQLLLRKYIGHVIDRESVAYLADHLRTTHTGNVVFTDAEWVALKLEEAAENETEEHRPRGKSS